MDLSKFDVVKQANKGFAVVLYNPSTMEDLDSKIIVLGQDSDVFRNTLSEQNKARVAKLTKRNVYKHKNATLAEIEIAAIELLAACTIGWENISEGKDAEQKDIPYPFTPENAVALYTKYPWIKEQVDQAFSDRKNFVTG